MKRRKGPLPLLLCLLCAGLGGCRPTDPVMPDDDRTIHIALAENQSTVVSWAYTADPADMLELVEDRYVVPKSKQPLCGAGGTHHWRFRPLHDGTVTLRFYEEPYQGGGLFYAYRVQDGVITRLPAPTPEPLGEIAALTYSHSGTTIDENYTWTFTRTADGTLAQASLCADREQISLDLPPEVLAEIQTLARDTEVNLWDGFHKSDPDILDGEGFSLSITLTDGREITASGTNSFPPGYRVFYDRLDGIIRQVTDAYYTE